MTPQERQEMRAAVAAEYGIALYRKYSEKEAFVFIGVDYTTLKHWRAAGKVPHVKMGDRNVAYMGFQIADIILFGTDKDKWGDTQTESSALVTGGYPSKPEAPLGAERGMTPKPDRQDVQALAQRILGKPGNS